MRLAPLAEGVGNVASYRLRHCAYSTAGAAILGQSRWYIPLRFLDASPWPHDPGDHWPHGGGDWQWAWFRPVGRRSAAATRCRCGKQHGKAKYSAAPTKKPQRREVLRDF